jgi:hypothetical protein
MLRRGVGRVGRPGLIGTMARTAVVAGTATAVSGGVARRQHARWQQEADAQAPPPAAPAASPVDLVAQLQGWPRSGTRGS